MRLLLPRIHVELVVTNAISNLLRREADIALRIVNLQQPDLIARRLGQVRIGAYAHRDYLQRRGIPQTPADLLAHDLIGGDTSTEVMDGKIRSNPQIRKTFDFLLQEIPKAL